MKSAVIVFPGSNCDRDAQVALRQMTGQEPTMVWHKDGKLPDKLDLIRGTDLERIEVICDRPLALQVDGEDLGDVEQVVFDVDRETLSVLVPEG